MAHRGASKAEAENTLAAFRRAGEVGADAVELDVRRSSDGVLVIHHNPHVADGRLVAATTRADLPASVPTLGDALDACGGMWVNVEIKNDPEEPDFDAGESIADETIAHLLARNEDERWLISCFRMETIDRCRALAPQIKTAWLCAQAPAGIARTLLSKGHLALHPWVAMLTRATIEECHAVGVQVNTWTCDDPARMAELVEWGIDGICTNLPDLALEVLGR
ncbi:MAG: glycerophosphodiester phosphodiesterase [Ilumatobacteraceae bacterium]